MKYQCLLILVLNFVSVNSLASPAGNLQREAAIGDFDFRGVVSIGRCSGSLVRFNDSLASDKGMILSNGHCVRFIKNGSAIVNSRTPTELVLFLGEDARVVGSTVTSSLLYATMTNTDLALFQLNESYEIIEDRFGVTPLTISPVKTVIDTEIEILSGALQQGYSCAIEAIPQILQEGPFFFKESLRYTRPGCEVVPGTSGSPILMTQSREVVAVNNSISSGNNEPCSIGNPCEIDENGSITFEKGYAYGQQVSEVYTCRDSKGRFDVTVDDCLLTR